MYGDWETFLGDRTCDFVGLVDEGADRTASGTAAKTYVGFCSAGSFLVCFVP